MGKPKVGDKVVCTETVYYMGITHYESGKVYELKMDNLHVNLIIYSGDSCEGDWVVNKYTDWKKYFQLLENCEDQIGLCDECDLGITFVKEIKYAKFNDLNGKEIRFDSYYDCVGINTDEIYYEDIDRWIKVLNELKEEYDLI